MSKFPWFCHYLPVSNAFEICKKNNKWIDNYNRYNSKLINGRLWLKKNVKIDVFGGSEICSKMDILGC